MNFRAMTPDGAAIAPLIDHTALKPDASRADIVRLCSEAVQYGFASVCVAPSRVLLAAAELRGAAVKVCSVIGFPLGASTSATKAYEAAEASREGARELDVVIAVGALKDGDLAYVLQDLKGVVESAGGGIVKVILETCLLTESEKETACRLAVEAGAAFVKTSTGLAGGGATEADVRLLRRVVGNRCGVKASGGIRTLAAARRLVAAGANRLGASAGVAIVTGD